MVQTVIRLIDYLIVISQTFNEDMQSIIKNNQTTTNSKHAFYTITQQFDYLRKNIENCDDLKRLFEINMALHTFMSYLTIYNRLPITSVPFLNIQAILKYQVS